MYLNFEWSKTDKMINEELENVSKHILNTLNMNSIRKYVKKFKLENLKILESSGTNIVLVSDNTEFVIQIYNNRETFKKIYSTVLDIITNPIICIKVTDAYNLYFDTTDYLVQPICFNVKRHSCFWEKIKPLNSFSLEKIKQVIRYNKYKIIWDIGKVLFAFHTNGYIHGDCTIDNIGIKNGNFVVFDFDGSSMSKNDEYIDYSKFFKSLYFHTDDIFFKDFYLEIEFNRGITLMNKILEEMDIKELEEMRVEY